MVKICVGRPHILFSYNKAIIKSFNIVCGVWPHKIFQTTISRHFIFNFYNIIVMVKICVGRPHKFVWAGHTFYIQGIYCGLGYIGAANI